MVFTIIKIDVIEFLIGEVKKLDDLDPRLPEEEHRALPVDDLVPFPLDAEHPKRTVQLGSRLWPKIRKELEVFIREHKRACLVTRGHARH